MEANAVAAQTSAHDQLLRNARDKGARVHNQAKVFFEISQGRVLFFLRERCAAIRQKYHLKISHGAIARRAVAANVGCDASDRNGIAAQGAQQILQLRPVKATVAKLLDHDIVLRRLQRLIDFRAWRALEIAPLIIGIMGLRFDIGKDAAPGQIFAFARMQVNHRNFSIMTISQQFLDLRNNILSSELGR